MTPLELGRKAIRFEIGMWRNLYRWIARRPVGPTGSQPFRYVGAVAPAIWGIIAVSAIEIPVLHLILPESWETARFLSILLGAYGLFWMFGMLAGYVIHPHLVSDEGLRVRNGTSVDFTVPWSAIASAGGRIRSLPRNRTVQVTDETLLNIGLSSATNVDFVLREPIRVPLPQGLSEPITEIRIWADDPNALRAKARESMHAFLP